MTGAKSDFLAVKTANPQQNSNDFSKAAFLIFYWQNDEKQNRNAIRDGLQENPTL